jgi:opacity protein-like surface antigen
LSIKRQVLPFLVLLALVLPNFISSSHAADGGQAPPQGIGKNEIGIKGGRYFPQSSDLDNFPSGGHFEASLMRNFSQYFGLGAAIGYFYSGHTTNVQFVTTEQDVNSTYLILNATLMIPAGAFVPYVEGGCGYYYNRIKESTSTASLSKEDDSFGYHAGAGLNWFFTKDYYIGLGGRYIWTQTNDPTIRLDGFLADVNLGIRF